jgi:hypothetical protein
MNAEVPSEPVLLGLLGIQEAPVLQRTEGLVRCRSKGFGYDKVEQVSMDLLLAVS